MLLFEYLSRKFIKQGIIVACLTAAGWFLPSVSNAETPIEAMEKSVVRVVTIKNGNISGFGTGFVLNSQGYIATNHHVIKKAQSNNLSLAAIPSGTTQRFTARIVWASQSRDLAILQADNLTLPPAKLAIGSIKKGKAVISMGFPAIADRLGRAADATITAGVIGRTFQGNWGKGGRFFRLVQHSAQINPGNSGGPLFDACGRVVGVNTQGSSAGRIIRKKDGTVKTIMAGTGVFFSSHISSLTDTLNEKGILFHKTSEECSDTINAADIAKRTKSVEKKAEKARVEAGQAKQDAEKAVQNAEKAVQDAETAKRETQGLSGLLKQWGAALGIWGVLITALLIFTLVFVMRRPRQQVMRVVEEASRVIWKSKLSGWKSSSDVKAAGKPITRSADKMVKSGQGLVLAGFSPEGYPVRVDLDFGTLSNEPNGLSIGRAVGFVDVEIASNAISRRHIRFSMKEGTVFIEDLNSSNGTHVNGQNLAPFSPSPFKAGDVITIADLELRASAI